MPRTPEYRVFLITSLALAYLGLDAQGAIFAPDTDRDRAESEHFNPLHDLDAEKFELPPELGRDLTAGFSDMSLPGPGPTTTLVNQAMTRLRADPTNVEAWIFLGDAYFVSERPGRAAAAFWRASRLQPDHPKALPNLGVSFLQLGDYSRATALFERLRTLRPEDEDIALNLGAAYHGLRDYVRAEEIYAGLVRRNPRNSQALYNLAVNRADQGRTAEALDLFQQSYQANTNNPSALFAAARLRARLQQPAAMLDLLERAVPQVPRPQVPLLLRHSVFDPWRDEPRFRALLAH